MSNLISRKALLCSRRPFLIAPSNYRRLSSRTSPLQSTYTGSPTSASAATDVLHPIQSNTDSTSKSATMPKISPLSILPLSNVVRSLVINTISSSPLLLAPSLKIMTILAHSQNPILSPDRNPVLRFFLKNTFYKQFCAGETHAEVQKTVRGIKDLGFKGVFLCYAREVEKSPGANIDVEKCVKNEVLPWAEGTLATVRLAGPGDFVSIKVTGAGSLALQALEAKGVCHDTLKKAIDDICALGAERGVKLAFDAEHAAVQAGIDLWTLKYMKRYNKPGKGGAVIYGTYQAYLKACPQVVANHMAIAQKENFTLGVKLVRGAYMGSDPRELIHDTKRETDECYDGIAEALIRQTPNAILKPENGAEKTFQAVDLALAGHNLESVRKAQVIRTEQAEKGEERIELCYAQLQGMADEVSCELVAEGKLAESMNSSHAQDSKVTVHGGINELIGGTKGGKDQLHLKTDIPKAYKYLTWGTTGECMKYLLRRAYENRDAVGRTREGRNEMGRELVRRVKGVFGA
ncbi:uncharacterized protein EAE98_009942 [Botrytis deweyae]|uniref:Proline dehydrogenase n=1 Tax=Botrytis deweyae TaxID=2478750 RepID=A0ABQ7I9Y4_9HELO|nr:uncharacterized protein EAE98_009942 [Botrytis deweyae]KAF7917914.1 hypothetical protein EAE98_009942 [Botrytis deweyae]